MNITAMAAVFNSPSGPDCFKFVNRAVEPGLESIQYKPELNSKKY